MLNTDKGKCAPDCPLCQGCGVVATTRYLGEGEYAEARCPIMTGEVTREHVLNTPLPDPKP